MIDGKPNYTRLSTIAMADVVLMDPEGRIQFINALCEMFENILDPDYQPEEKPGFVGRAIQRQFAEFREGTRKYMDNVNRNPSGLSKQFEYPQGIPMGNPVGSHSDPPKEKNIEKRKEKKKEDNNLSIKKGSRFIAPTLEEVSAYCQERGNGINAAQFIDYYAARGWELKQGQKMKDWKAAVRIWEHNQKKEGGNNGGYSGDNGSVKTDYSFLRDGSDSV